MLLARLCCGNSSHLHNVVAALRTFSAAAADLSQSHRASIAGQPTPWTHPELLRPGELQPGISDKEVAHRRQRLCNALPANSLAVLPSADITYMSGVIPFPYRQDADFLYLTGINQRAVAVLQTGSARSTSASSGSASGAAQQQAQASLPPHQPGDVPHKFVLFIPPPDEAQERWDGATLGKQAAQDMFGAHEVHYISELYDYLEQAADQASAVICDDDRAAAFRSATLQRALQGAARRRQVARLRPYMHLLRWRKSPGEVELMRRSARASAQALVRCMQMSYGGAHEAQVAATFEYECRLAGAARLAFPPVTAGGRDACTIHYSRNDKHVVPGQLLLMDAGCELHGYASDVTRTWPVSGAFSGPQRAVYELVLHVHQQCLAAARPGASIRKLHDLSVRLICEGLHELRLLPGASPEALQQGPYRQLYWHSVGHYLGLDTHDTGSLGHDRTLEAGAVITIEPGLYVPDEPRFGPFRGIGVRLEDDVLVGPGGAEVLSCDAPVEAAEVEQLVRGGRLHEPQLAYHSA